MIDEIKEIIGAVIEIPATEISDDASPENTSNWDSIRHMEILTKLEEKYGTSFDMDEMMEMMSLSGIVEVLKRKQNG